MEGIGPSRARAHDLMRGLRLFADFHPEVEARIVIYRINESEAWSVTHHLYTLFVSDHPWVKRGY